MLACSKALGKKEISTKTRVLKNRLSCLQNAALDAASRSARCPPVGGRCGSLHDAPAGPAESTALQEPPQGAQRPPRRLRRRRDGAHDVAEGERRAGRPALGGLGVLRRGPQRSRRPRHVRGRGRGACSRRLPCGIKISRRLQRRDACSMFPRRSTPTAAATTCRSYSRKCRRPSRLYEPSGSRSPFKPLNNKTAGY